MRRLALLVLPLAVLTTSASASALEHQHHVGLDPSLAILKIDDKSTASVGAGLGVHYTYGIDDQFMFMAEASLARVATDQKQDLPDSPHTRPADVANLSAGVGYVIDILQFVPYLGAMVGTYRMSGGTLDDALYLAGVSGKVGLDYQLSRSFALGVAGEQHFLFTKMSTYPSYTQVTLKAEYVWGF
ncbi:MAG: hypothetical protein JWP97_3411 [Labilithrix sp.]|nr:hypothetical protein [Labilithrix sp.]